MSKDALKTSRVTKTQVVDVEIDTFSKYAVIEFVKLYHKLSKVLVQCPDENGNQVLDDLMDLFTQTGYEAFGPMEWEEMNLDCIE